MLEVCFMELRDLLMVLISGGGGVVVYWLLEHVPTLANLSPEYKRYASLILAALLPIPFYLLGVAMQYWPAPVDWRAWVEILFAIAAGAVIASQAVHGREQLRVEPTD
jgi:hypothetical protein